MIIDFTNLSYLKKGNPKQQVVSKLLIDNKIFEKISKYDPILTGTIPIAMDIHESDLDINCKFKSKSEFINLLTKSFKKLEDFEIVELEKNFIETVICRFEIDDFKFEIFGQARPVEEQDAYRHMMIEYKILQKRGSKFRGKVLLLRKQGMKTEPAFAALLGIKGDPYVGLLRLKD